MISKFIAWLQERKERKQALSIQPAQGQRWVNKYGLSVLILEADYLGTIQVEATIDGITHAPVRLNDWPAYVKGNELNLYRPSWAEEGY
jgi:hypothetical protein